MGAQDGTTDIEVVFDPAQRLEWLRDLLHLDGLGDVDEDPATGYGIIALTGLGSNISRENEVLKDKLQRKQRILQEAMAATGVTHYDPASAPYSPDTNLDATPGEVYRVDTKRVALARHVTYVDILPTTGGGIEQEKARRLGKFLYIFHDPDIRTSRMQVDRAVHLSLKHLSGAKDQLVELFRFVHAHDPCIGFDQGLPAMIGKNRETGAIVNLEKEVAARWPGLVYDYDPHKQILEFETRNARMISE